MASPPPSSGASNGLGRDVTAEASDEEERQPAPGDPPCEGEAHTELEALAEAELEAGSVGGMLVQELPDFGDELCETHKQHEQHVEEEQLEQPEEMEEEKGEVEGDVSQASIEEPASPSGGDVAAVRQLLKAQKVQQWTAAKGWKARREDLASEVQAVRMLSMPKIVENQEEQVPVRLQSNCSLALQESMSSVCGCSITSSVAPTNDAFPDDASQMSYKYLGEVFPMAGLQRQPSAASIVEFLCWDGWRGGTEANQAFFASTPVGADAETGATPEGGISTLQSAGSSMAQFKDDAQLSKGDTGGSSALQRVRRPKPGALVIAGAAAGAAARTAGTASPGTFGSTARAACASSPRKVRSPSPTAASLTTGKMVAGKSQRRSPIRSSHVDAPVSPSRAIGGPAALSPKPQAGPKAKDIFGPATQPDLRSKVGFDQPRRAVRQRIADRHKLAWPLTEEGSEDKDIPADVPAAAAAPVTPPPPPVGLPVAPAALPLAVAPVVPAAPLAVSPFFPPPVTVRPPGVAKLTLPIAAPPPEQQTPTAVSPHSSCGPDGSTTFSVARASSPTSEVSLAQSSTSVSQQSSPCRHLCTAEGASPAPVVLPAPPALPGSLLSWSADVTPQLASPAAEVGHSWAIPGPLLANLDDGFEGCSLESAATHASRGLMQPASPHGSSQRAVTPMAAGARFSPGKVGPNGATPGGPQMMSPQRTGVTAPLARGRASSPVPLAGLASSVGYASPSAAPPLAWMANFAPRHASPSVQSPRGTLRAPGARVGGGSPAPPPQAEAGAGAFVGRGQPRAHIGFGSGQGKSRAPPSVSPPPPSRGTSPPPLGLLPHGASLGGVATPQQVGTLPPTTVISATSRAQSPVAQLGRAQSPALPRVGEQHAQAVAAQLRSPIAPVGNRIPSYRGSSLATAPTTKEPTPMKQSL